MSRAFLLLVTGPPCSGKSQLATTLARDTGLPEIGKDRFKEILFNTLGVGSPAWSQRLGRAAFELQLGVADAMLATGLGVLLEGNFREAEYGDRLRRLAAGRARLIQVACIAAPAVLEARCRARAARADRHPGHLDAQARWSAAAADSYRPLAIDPTLRYDSGSGQDCGYDDLRRELESLGLRDEGPSVGVPGRGRD